MAPFQPTCLKRCFLATCFSQIEAAREEEHESDEVTENIRQPEHDGSNPAEMDESSAEPRRSTYAAVGWAGRNDAVGCGLSSIFAACTES